MRVRNKERSTKNKEDVNDYNDGYNKSRSLQ